MKDPSPPAVLGCSVLLWLAAAAAAFEPRAYDGTGNNLMRPLWGSVNITQVRSVAGAAYSDGVSGVSGEDRPSAREVTTGIFLTAPAIGAPQSALFVAWGQLVSFDLFLGADNRSEPFEVPCNENAVGDVDVWCPLGDDSDPIPFLRSDAEVGSSSGVRNPINYATSYIDLDFMYGRSEAAALELRSMDGGMMDVSDDGTPFQNSDGTWKVADQRTTQLPVTFALLIVLLLEHNRCCTEVAPRLGYEGDEDLYQACRGWTIAVFQHIVKNDFSIRLVGMAVLDEYDSDGSIDSSSYSSSSSSTSSSPSPSSLSSSGTPPPDSSPRRAYNDEINAGADVFVTTVGVAAFYAAIPPTVRIMEPGYVPAKEDNVELIEAANDLAGFFERNGVANILRGAVLSATLRPSAHFTLAVSNASPKFKIPVDAIQRGRDHGIPTYNDAREAYGLSRISSFDNITSDPYIRTLLTDIYGGDVSLLDALTGGLAEGNEKTTLAIFGDLLENAWADQLYRSLAGDRLLYNSHENPIEAVNGTTLQDLIMRTVNVTDLSVSPFTIPELSVCYDNCTSDESLLVALADEFMLGWDIKEDCITYTISAKFIGEEGYLSIGYGGTEMATAEDYVICEVIDADTANCTDRTASMREPGFDDMNPELHVEEVVIDGDWTSVTFVRFFVEQDSQDYDVLSDYQRGSGTALIYAYREGEGVGQHTNANRGAAIVNFDSATSVSVCQEDSDFFLFHGALILIAWMVLAPAGIYYARYRKGDIVVMGNHWWEMHAELMAVATEIVLPLSITAIFSSTGSTEAGTHSSEHAKWGFYMIGGLITQVGTGWFRAQALLGKQSNFSTLHRINKHVHIWSGHIAFVAGAVQCYRGVELVSSQDSLVFSTFEIDYQVGSFGVVYQYVFPAWVAAICLAFLFLEINKQIKRFHSKGAAVLLCCLRIKNADYVPEARVRGGNGEEVDERIIPRTKALPIYTIAEFNYKVLNGESWVIVDGAILDILDFMHRHPGGARVLMNALGTDVTSELIGEDAFDGNPMTFSPHQHTEGAWELVLSQVVGYIEDEEEEFDDDEDSTIHGNNGAPPRSEASQRIKYDAYETRGFQSHIARGDGGEEKQSKQKGGSSEEVVGREGEHEGGGGRPPELSSGRMSPKSVTSAAGMAKSWVSDTFRRKSAGVLPSPPADVVARPTATSHVRSFKSTASSGKVVLQRFHVCSFLLRERMDGGVGDRPVYRYVFSCPEAMMRATTGVCHFNMRIMRRDREVIVQRSYNAMAVRAIYPTPLTPSAPSASSKTTLYSDTTDGHLSAQQGGTDGNPATGRGGTSTANNPNSSSEAAAGVNDSISGTTRSSIRGRFFKDALRAGVRPSFRRTMPRKVVRAEESNKGLLCLEMRIRLLRDGAMGKLLEQLDSDPENATVQLQGPFPVRKLSPPLPHRKVIMIAGGTGINPMVQLIRDYQNLDRDGGVRALTAGSRLTLLWQVASAADLYCLDELKSLEARSRGLLNWTALITGGRRKTNDPAAPTAFFRQRNKPKPKSQESTTAGNPLSAQQQGRQNYNNNNNARPRLASYYHQKRPLIDDDGDDQKEDDGEEKLQQRSISLSCASSIASPGLFVTPPPPSPLPRTVSYSAAMMVSPAPGLSRDSPIRSDVPRGVFSFPANSKRSVVSDNSTSAPDFETSSGAGRGQKYKKKHSFGTKRRKYFVTPDDLDDNMSRQDSHVSRLLNRWSEQSEEPASPQPVCDETLTKATSLRVSPGGGDGYRKSPVAEIHPGDNAYRARSSFFRMASQRAIESATPAWKAEAKRTDADMLEKAWKSDVRQWEKDAVKLGMRSAEGKRVRSASFGASGRNLSGEPSVGKVTKVILREALGAKLTEVVYAFKEKQAAFTEGTNFTFNRRAEIEALCGTRQLPGELQVVLCGPSGFVFHVEAMLDEMGVPPEAVVVLLD